MSENGQHELDIIQDNRGLVPKEDENSLEKLKISNRVLVYGCRVSGTFEFVQGLEKYLVERGISDLSVEACRNVRYIKDAFYNRDSVKPGNEGSTITSRPSDVSKNIPTLPKGVIVLPKMRQRTPHGQSMTIPSPYEYIKKLCDEHGIPVVKMDGESISPDQLSEGVAKVLTESKTA